MPLIAVATSLRCPSVNVYTVPCMFVLLRHDAAWKDIEDQRPCCRRFDQEGQKGIGEGQGQGPQGRWSVEEEKAGEEEAARRYQQMILTDTGKVAWRGRAILYLPQQQTTTSQVSSETCHSCAIALSVDVQLLMGRTAVSALSAHGTPSLSCS